MTRVSIWAETRWLQEYQVMMMLVHPSWIISISINTSPCKMVRITICWCQIRELLHWRWDMNGTQPMQGFFFQFILLTKYVLKFWICSVKVCTLYLKCFSKISREKPTSLFGLTIRYFLENKHFLNF